MKKKIVILGAGGFAKELIWIIKDINDKQKKEDFVYYDILGLIDEDKGKDGLMLMGYKIYGELKSPLFWNKNFKNWDNKNINVNKDKAEKIFAICSLGNAKGRAELIEKATMKGFNFVSLIHPNVIKSEYITIGEGSIIMPGTVLTVDVKIGKHVLINKLCSIGHDSEIRNFCTLAPGVKIGGNVVIEEKCDIGMNATIIQSVRIGRETTVGAGAVVLNDLPDKCVAVGVPAKIIKYKN